MFNDERGIGFLKSQADSSSCSISDIVISNQDSFVAAQNINSCPDCGVKLVRLGSCFSCPRCGYGSCG